MKYILILTFLLSAGCNHCAFEEHALSHSCPKEGHGPCYLCDDPLNSKIVKK